MADSALLRFTTSIMTFDKIGAIIAVNIMPGTAAATNAILSFPKNISREIRDNVEAIGPAMIIDSI